MSSRDDILARVRKNQPCPQPLPPVPTFDAATESALNDFKAALARMGGKLADVPADGDLDALVRQLFPDAKVVCSATPEVAGNRQLDRVRHPAELSDVDVGVVRALFGVAETGSVWITDAQFKVSSLGFLSQHLVVLLDPARIRGEPASRLPRTRAVRRRVRGIHDRAVGNGRHRRGTDPRRPGHPNFDRRCDRPFVAQGADNLPRRHL